MLNQQTIDQLHRMRLGAFADELKHQAEKPEDYAAMSFEERLAFLVEQQWLARENKSLAQRLQRAKLRQPACLEDINYHHPRGLDRNTVRQLARCTWVREKENILVIGKTGLGKSYLACALANQACREGFTALYTRLPRLLAEIDLARANGTYPNVMRRIAKVRVLVIDDWGLAPLGDVERRDVLELLEDRYDQGSVVITSQLPVKSWHALVGDATLADAILDRIVHNSHRINLEGETMRKPENKKKGLKKEAKDE